MKRSAPSLPWKPSATAREDQGGSEDQIYKTPRHKADKALSTRDPTGLPGASPHQPFWSLVPRILPMDPFQPLVPTSPSQQPPPAMRKHLAFAACWERQESSQPGA